jgi:hypothetical protein
LQGESLFSLGLFVILLMQMSFEDVGKLSTLKLLRNKYSREAIIKMLIG